ALASQVGLEWHPQATMRKGKVVMSSKSIISSLDVSYVVSNALHFETNMEQHQDRLDNGLM
ncbi:unnamed protein product, partial [Ilex paraguariensis]